MLEDELPVYLPGTWLCEGDAGWKKWKKFYFEGRYYNPLTQESYNQLRNALKNQNSLDYILGRYPLPTSGVVITSLNIKKQFLYDKNTISFCCFID